MVANTANKFRWITISMVDRNIFEICVDLVLLWQIFISEKAMDNLPAEKISEDSADNSASY